MDVRTSGPLFDGRARSAARRLRVELQDTTAQRGLVLWRQTLQGSLRHPTGRYEARLNVERGGPTDKVNDHRSVYGPWLEGTGSRNRTTKFKGYLSMRRAVQKLTTELPRIFREIAPRYVRSMND